MLMILVADQVWGLENPSFLAGHSRGLLAGIQTKRHGSPTTDVGDDSSFPSYVSPINTCDDHSSEDKCGGDGCTITVLGDDKPDVIPKCGYWESMYLFPGSRLTRHLRVYAGEDSRIKTPLDPR